MQDNVILYGRTSSTSIHAINVAREKRIRRRKKVLEPFRKATRRNALIVIGALEVNCFTLALTTILTKQDNAFTAEMHLVAV